MHQNRIILTLACMVGISIGCSASPTNSPIPTPDLTVEAESTVLVATQRGNEVRATELRGTINAIEQESINQTATQEQHTAEAGATATERQANLEAAKAESTAQAKPMQEVVQNLYAEGYLETIDGTYNTIGDFDESWAQINWYQWLYTGYSPTDFVIRANAAWDSAFERANLFNSGCGFVFREDGAANHYLAYLGMDGYVYFGRNLRNREALLGNSYYGKLEIPSGEAQIMLVVEGINITFFVNGTRVHSRQDQGLESGNLALTLLSGTNKGFGTRCQMTNIELWELE